jgi:hypothetical protein
MRWENVFPYRQASFRGVFEFSTFRGSWLARRDTSEKLETMTKVSLFHLDSDSSAH